MKAKMNLDKQAIQGFFVRHVEKLVLAGLLAVFLGLAYGAATRPKYDQQPRALADAAAAADANIEQIKQPIAPDWAKVNPYPEIAQRSRNVVSETAYVWRRPIDPRIWPELSLRPEPPLFATEDLKGTAGVGAFQMKIGASGQQQVGQRWIVITGLVPAAKQVQAYAETFKDLKRPESDTPKYIHYWVERAEMFGDARDANPVWAQINVLEAKRIQSSWTTTAQEVVAAPFIHDPLVFPLGPLQSGSWDESVAHPPKIRLASAALNGTPQPVDAAKRVPGSDLPQPDMPPGVAKPPADLPPAAPAGGGAPAAAGGGVAVAAAPGPAGGAGGGIPMAAAPAAEATDGAGEGHGHTADVGAVEYLLLRFFDFKVEPGKRYAYRVKLLLENPNYKCETRYLASPALAEKRFIESDWSEPSTPVFVPRDDRLLAGPVKAPTRAFGAEPVATVTLVKWMAERGTETSHEFKIVRGQLANLASDATGLAEGEGGEADAGGLIDDAATTKAKRKDKDSGPKINFKSDALLLDVRGGTKWGSQAFEPGELLLLDYDGRLIVRSEIDDIPLLPKPKVFTEESEVKVTTEKDNKDKDKKTKSSLFGDDFGDKKSKKDKSTGKKKER